MYNRRFKISMANLICFQHREVNMKIIKRHLIWNSRGNSDPEKGSMLYNDSKRQRYNEEVPYETIICRNRPALK